MGYLSQKKKNNNIRELLNFSLVALFVGLIILLFFRESQIASSINAWLFQVYVCTLVIFVIAIFYKFYWRALGLFVAIFLLYLNIGMGSNLFVNVKTPGLQTVNLLYHSNTQNLTPLIKQAKRYNIDFIGVNGTSNIQGDMSSYLPYKTVEPITKRDSFIITHHEMYDGGEILLSPHNQASFATVILDSFPLVVVSLDFRNSPQQELKTALSNLAEFVNIQDSPVILFGNFGMEAWSYDFQKFLEKTDLEVKNSVLLQTGAYSINPLQIPQFNVLAYKDFGIFDLKFLSVKDNTDSAVYIKLNF